MAACRTNMTLVKAVGRNGEPDARREAPLGRHDQLAWITPADTGAGKGGWPLGVAQDKMASRSENHQGSDVGRTTCRGIGTVVDSSSTVLSLRCPVASRRQAERTWGEKLRHGRRHSTLRFGGGSSAGHQPDRILFRAFGGQ